jgi:hypothetical protein
LVLRILDWVLTIVHALVVLGNLVLWIPRRTLRVHLVLVLCTTASWLGLGAFYGIGYCFLTDWHWRIKHELGERGLPGSFIEYSLERLTGRDLDAGAIKYLTVVAFAVAGSISLLRNYLVERRKRSHELAVPK